MRTTDTDASLVENHKKPDSAPVLGTMRRTLAASLVALVVASGCIAQDPPGKDFTEDLQQDFENEDYFNP